MIVMPSGSSSGGPDEWSAIRSLIASYDSNLHDLRKTGLAVITALLTATAVSTLFNLPVYEAVVLILLTYLLILIMQYLDQHYRTFQSAAMTRARVIEPLLNVEMSRKIATVYREKHAYLINPALYCMLIVITCLLGCAIVGSSFPGFPSANSPAENITPTVADASIVVMSGEAPAHSAIVQVNLTSGSRSAPAAPAPVSWWQFSFWLLCLLLVLVIAGIVCYAMLRISNTVQIDVRRNGRGLPDDWVVDKISCVKGDVVKITVTNLGKTAIQHKITGPGGSVTVPGLGGITVTGLDQDETIIRFALEGSADPRSRDPAEVIEGRLITITDTGNLVTVSENFRDVPLPECGREITIPDPEMTVIRKSPGELVITLGGAVRVTKKGTSVTVTEGGLLFAGTVCTIVDETGRVIDKITVGRDVVIPYHKNHSWLWDTAPPHVRANAMYTLWPRGWKSRPLAQIAVLDQPSDAKKPQPEKVRDFECWSVDKASCTKGGAVTITVTNVSCPCEGKTLVFKKGDMVCRIHPDGRDHGAQITADTAIEIPPDGSYSWLWDTTPDDVKENTLYRITPGTFTIMPDDQRQPTKEKSLHQTVTVLKKEAGSGT